MNYVWLTLEVIFVCIPTTICFQCHVKCPEDGKMVCGFERRGIEYKMFPSECAMKAYSICAGVEFDATPLKYCVKHHYAPTRKMYGESCPVFCPEYYRPVCGASKFRDYIYRSFINGCYLDMINCRGDDDFTGYVEVPLHYCQRHSMKNIFSERIVMPNTYDTRDYY